MDRLLSRSFIIVLLLSGAVFAQSQPGPSLGDIARANRAKQQAQEAAGTMPKVITNRDLPANPPGVPESSESEPMTTVSGVERADLYSEPHMGNRMFSEQPAGGQWRNRIQEQESRIADLQSRINAMGRSSAGTAQYYTPGNRYQANQTQRLARMQWMLEQQKQRLEMMQDAARHAGVNQ